MVPDKAVSTLCRYTLQVQLPNFIIIYKKKRTFKKNSNHLCGVSTKLPKPLLYHKYNGQTTKKNLIKSSTSITASGISYYHLFFQIQNMKSTVNVRKTNLVFSHQHFFLTKDMTVGNVK